METESRYIKINLPPVLWEVLDEATKAMSAATPGENYGTADWIESCLNQRLAFLSALGYDKIDQAKAIMMQEMVHLARLIAMAEEHLDQKEAESE